LDFGFVDHDLCYAALTATKNFYWGLLGQEPDKM